MSNWKMVPLGECCEVVSGATPKRERPEYWGGSVNWVTPKDISSLKGTTLYKTPECITDGGYQSCSASMLPKGAILLSSRAPIGNVAITGVEMCTNQGFKSLVPRKDVDSLYLYYVVRAYSSRLAEKGTGATFKEVSKEVVSNFKIPLPPIEEQRHIAAILDKADSIRRKWEQALALADDFLRSTFIEMFGDPALNPKGWEMAPIRDFGVVTTGNTPSRKISHYYGESIEWIKSDNINTPHNYLTVAKERLSEKGREVGRVVPAGSVLVTCIAGSFDCIGNAAISDRAVAFNQQINAITPAHNLDTEYLYMHLVVGKKLIQNASTNSMKGMVSKSKFQDITLMKPPKKARIEYSRAFGSLVKFRDNMSRNHLLSDDMFSSFSQRAFRGEL